MCDDYKRCEKCGNTYRKSKYPDPKSEPDLGDQLTKHDCREVHCSHCRGIFPHNHVCFIKKIPILDLESENFTDDEPDTGLRELATILGYGDGDNESADTDTDESNIKFIMFDFESMFVNNQHIPNLCVAEWRCEVCLQNEKDGKPRDTNYKFPDASELDDPDLEIKYPKTTCRCSAERVKAL